MHGVEEQKRELSAQRQFRDTEDNLAQEFSKASRDGKQSQRSKHNTDQYHTQRMNTQNYCLLVRCAAEPHNKQIAVEINIESRAMTMEVDTGSCITLITHVDYD